MVHMNMMVTLLVNFLLLIVHGQHVLLAGRVVDDLSMVVSNVGGRPLLLLSPLLLLGRRVQVRFIILLN